MLQLRHPHAHINTCVCCMPLPAPHALTEPVLKDLECCKNRLCSKCKEEVAEKHEACPFCRAFLTTPQQQERKRLQQQQQQLQQQLNSSRGTRSSRHSSQEDSWSDEDGSYTDSDDYEGYSSDDEYGSPGSNHPGPMDTTVLLAAAAEAAAAAHAGPRADCGLCGSTWLRSSMGASDALPGMSLCRRSALVDRHTVGLQQRGTCCTLCKFFDNKSSRQGCRFRNMADTCSFGPTVSSDPR